MKPRETFVITSMQTSLQQSIREFRLGHDCEGMEYFKSTMLGIQGILAYNRVTQSLHLNREQLLFQFDTLLQFMRNDDITEFVDWLEYELTPFLINSVREGDCNEDCESI